MSEDDKYQIIISNLESKSTSKVNNALAYVRAKLIKEKNGVAKLCRYNIVKILLRFLEAEEDGDKPNDLPSEVFWKQADLCLSILSNMCMEKAARNAMKNVPNSILTLVTLLEDQEKETIKNRTTRTLANLALDPAICHDIVKTAAVEQVVEFMNTTEDRECLKTCCRALRLFGHSDKNRDKVAAQIGIYPVARLLKHEDKDLSEYGLKALSELSRKCTFECASQIQNAGVIEKIVELAEEEGKWNGDNFAIKIFINLMEQPNARASIGSSGGIAFVLRLLEEEITKPNTLPLLNALCLFCRESVNRVRIREKGILDIFAKALQDESLTVLHARIISAIVCFVYDEKGLKYLLSLGLVDILLKHFQSFAKFSSSVNPSFMKCTEIDLDLTDMDFVKNGSKKRKLESPERLDISQKKVCCSTVVKEDICLDSESLSIKVNSTVSEQILDKPKDINSKKAPEDLPCVAEKIEFHFSHVSVHPANTVSNNVKLADESKTGSFKENKTSDSIEINASKAHSTEDPPEARYKTHVYSLDSPTYEAQYAEWSLDEFKSSVKCKQSFSPDSLSQRSVSPNKLSAGSSPYYPEPVSPLSVSSHYSPDYSPQYSPLRTYFLSPASSPRRASTSSYVGSPQRSISPSDFSDSTDLGLGPVEEDPGLWEYSSDEDGTATQHTDPCEGSGRKTKCGARLNDMKNAKDGVLVKSDQGQSKCMLTPEPPDTVSKDTVDIKSNIETPSHSLTESPLSNKNSAQVTHRQTVDIDGQDSDNISGILKTCRKADSSSDFSEATVTKNVGSTSDPPKTVTDVLNSTSDTPNTATNVDSNSNTPKIANNIESTCDAPEKTANVESTSGTTKETKKIKSANVAPKPAKNVDRKESVRLSTVDNILILFSRISQMPDPRALLSEKFICCLLDYVTIADTSPRASRILQRLMQHPLCLENLLDVLAPIYIVQKIHSDNPPITPPKSCKEVPCDVKRIKRSLSVQSGSTSDTDYFEEAIDPVIDNITINNALLQDLSFVVESTYGRGTVAHILKRKSQGEKLRCLLCLPFLCRNSTAQQRTLFQDEALQQLLNPKLLLSSTDFLRIAVLGLHFLSSFSRIQLKLPSCDQPFPVEENGRTSSMTFIKTDQRPSNLTVCFHASCEAGHDLVFLLDRDIKLTGQKSVLVLVSPVFQAMLEGDYSESRQNQINIPHISADAFQFLLHFLHGCDLTCKVIDLVVAGAFSLNAFLDTITLADRYLLADLQYYLVCLARQKYLNFLTLKTLYHFSILQSEVLAEDCLRYFLTHDADMEQRVSVFSDLLSSSHSDTTLEHLHQVLKCHIYGPALIPT